MRAVRVATFNVCHGTDGRGTAVDLDRLVAACAALDADVLALQEVDRGARRSGRVDQPATLAERLGMACVYGPAHPVDGGTMGNALLVRGNVADAQVLALRGRPRWGRRDRRCALLARVRVGDLSVSVASTHLSTARPDSDRQLPRVLDALAERPGPRLLLGDLNRRTPWVAGAAAARTLRLVDDDVPTAPRTAPRFRIDHVAVGGLVAGAAEVVDAGISDHRALVVEVRPPSPVGPSPH